MSAATQIAGKDLRLRIRDKSAITIGLIAPLALAFIFDLIFSGAFEAQEFDLQYGYVDLDQSEVSQQFTRVLDSIAEDGLYTLEEFDSAAAAETEIEDGELDAFWLIPEGMGAAIVAAEETTVEVIGDIDAQTSTQIAVSIADGFGERVAASQLSVVTASELSSAPPGPADIGTWAQSAAAREPAYVISDETAATRQLDGTTYFAAGMAVFFLFFTVQFGVSGLLEEERDGTLARLIAAPIARSSVVLGKALLSFLLGVVSMGILVTATHFLLGATWGAPLGVILLVLAGVLSATTIIGLVASVAKTPEGAGNLGAVIAVTLGMFGGVFFQVGSGDDFLSKLSYLTPHRWFMEGLAELQDGAPWTAALPAVGALLLFALVTGTIGWVLVNRRLAK